MVQGDQLQTFAHFSKTPNISKSKWQLSFNIFRQHSVWGKINTNCIKLQTIDPEILILILILIFNFNFNFNFPEKGLGLVFPPHFVYDFSRKMFLLLHLLTDQISLSDFLCFWRYWIICVLQLFINQAVMSWNLKLTQSF